MRNRHILILALVALAGCKGIRGVRVEPSRPLTLTVAEAEKSREDGLKLYGEQPRSLVRVTRAAQQLEITARTLREDYDAQWQAAQALAFLAEHETRPDFRKEAAKRGVVFARHGRELKPNRVESHYWYAINVGLLADVDREYGLDAVSEMESALKRAGEIDEWYDYAGPLRVLGILHLRTPAPPVSIGSPRKGQRLLQRATDLFPDYPENHLYLAEAFRDNGNLASAKIALNKVLDAKPWPAGELESAEWRTSAEKMLRELPNP